MGSKQWVKQTYDRLAKGQLINKKEQDSDTSAVICGTKITYCIYRTEYPLGLSPKIWPAAHFVW